MATIMENEQAIALILGLIYLCFSFWGNPYDDRREK